MHTEYSNMSHIPEGQRRPNHYKPRYPIESSLRQTPSQSRSFTSQRYVTRVSDHRVNGRASPIPQSGSSNQRRLTPLHTIHHCNFTTLWLPGQRRIKPQTHSGQKNAVLLWKGLLNQTFVINYRCVVLPAENQLGSKRWRSSTKLLPHRIIR